jgi:hypothetical protein
MLYKEDGKTINDDAMELLIEADAQRVQRLKDGIKPAKELLESQYKRGIKESMVNFEKEFKQKTGHEADLQGIELVMDYVESLKQAKTKLSDDEFKLDRRYIDAEKTWKKTVSETEARLIAERDGIVQQYQKKEKFGRIKNDVKVILESLNPVLPSDAKVRDNQVNTFLKLFENGYDYELQDDGNHVIVDGQKRLEDKHGNPITFKQFAESKITDYFELAKQSARDSSGNKNTAAPRNNDEFLAAARAAKTPEQAKQVYEQYHGANHSASYNK